MQREEILRRFQNLMMNSNIDFESNLFKEAMDAFIAIALKEIEDEMVTE